VWRLPQRTVTLYHAGVCIRPRKVISPPTVGCWTRDGTDRDCRDQTRQVNLSVKPAGTGWPTKITTFRSDIASRNRKNSSIHYSKSVRLHYVDKCQLSLHNHVSIEWKKIANFVINEFVVCLCRFARVPLCILCGRPITHLSSNVDPTPPDRQPAPVDPTGFHLCSWTKKMFRRLYATVGHPSSCLAVAGSYRNRADHSATAAEWRFRRWSRSRRTPGTRWRGCPSCRNAATSCSVDVADAECCSQLSRRSADQRRSTHRCTSRLRSWRSAPSHEV